MIKPKTFLLTSLLLPYLIWLISFIPFSISHDLTKDYPTLDFLLGLSTFFSLAYTFGVVFWGIPYTTLVIGLLIWSRNKSVKRVYTALFYSPLLMVPVTMAGFLIVFFYSVIMSEPRIPLLLINVLSFVWFSFTAAIFITVFGYFFVGISAGAYQMLKYLKVIKSEEEITQNILGAPSESLKNDFQSPVE